ncbi:glycerol dehydrogenase [Nocardia sp. CDC186]|uniref:Glycerol dehydrogenase n=1 Tax=Nocardia implantans TaxID=3108168 RepID=A0ABU6B1Q5_9NOCA|nr:MULTISPECIES: glycerol dehydrogenase [unclassified Nocardia]MBF6195406.1 glycerol dehydrogenase [Nocardia beijingensis]MEA3532086.1 glycerol dehydrogenase [Nocardia sp. CDC192]MEB3513324.1 glycerol dehydrogenase [Nocardia sp. CDC186]
MLSVFSSPGHYVQGRDATAALGAEMTRLGIGGPVLIVAGSSAFRLLAATWERSLTDAKIAYSIHLSGGECSRAEIARIAHAVEESGSTVVLGAGGGKVLDAARAVADDLDLPMISCPSTASSDAPCSALSVIYTDSGEFEAYQLVRRNPALVLVDTSVVAQAPPRLLAAGMGDALATWFEARTCSAAQVRNMRGGASTRSATALAELCYRTLLADGAQALAAVRTHSVTPALERVVEANTLLSGLGFESSGLAAAHAVHNGLTAAAGTRPFLHGEKVAFGTLTQLVLEGAPASEIGTVLGFCAEVGLPTTLAALGLPDADDETLRAIARRATAPGETIHNEPFTVNVAMVVEALRAADAIGQ